jgi:hypothetical protein
MEKLDRKKFIEMYKNNQLDAINYLLECNELKYHEWGMLILEMRENKITDITFLVEKLNKIWHPDVWNVIIFFMNFSEDFLEKYKENFSLNEIIKNQNVSFDFLVKHNASECLEELKENTKINQDVKEKFIKYTTLIK